MFLVWYNPVVRDRSFYLCLGELKTMDRIMIAVLLVCCTLKIALVQGQENRPSRTWTDVTGEFRIEAELVRIRGDEVVLRRADKREITLPLAKLSKADQEYALGQLRLDNNLKCIDLSDLVGRLPLKVIRSKRILRQSEDWEHSTWTPDEKELDSVGYPSVVLNDRGLNPDGKYYLFYAHHEPTSGIGCAVSDAIDGPYTKLASLDPDRKHSMVLVNPHSPGKVGDPSHYSTPSVVWNGDEQLWFMYFHYYNHFHRLWEESPDHPGGGNQMTALATSPDLAAQQWTVVKDKSLAKVSVHDILPVLTTSKEPWMYGTSSYNAIQRLPDGQWLAFLRGTSNQGLSNVGFATSEDGRKWDYFPENPVLRGDPREKKNLVRPGFIGFLGNDRGGMPQYLVVWTESKVGADVPRVRYGYTSDFVQIRPDSRGFAEWPAGDGFICPWREGNRLYLFSGKHVHVMRLPVATR